MLRTRMVVAQHDEVIRWDLSEELRDAGYEVVGEAGDGASAVRLARELRPDLVISCIIMPALDGLEVADILTREQIAPVLLITALPDDASIARACAAGVIGYIVKPWRAQNLRPAIELALYRHHTARDLAVYAATLEDQPAMRKVVEDQLATRKVVEAAQARLVARYQLDPHQALRRIAKLAMNRRLSMRQAAEAILLADDAPS